MSRVHIPILMVLPGLMVGHTHEDIDQLFSLISKAMMNKSESVELRTPSQFDTFLREKVFNCPTTVTRLTSTYDLDSRIGKAANPHLKGLGHSQWALEGVKNPAHCIQFGWSNEAKERGLHH